MCGSARLPATFSYTMPEAYACSYSFEPGAGGEFKLLRGFDATPTESMHWIADPRFAHAVDRFLVHERRVVESELGFYAERTALRRDRPEDE